MISVLASTVAVIGLALSGSVGHSPEAPVRDTVSFSNRTQLLVRERSALQKEAIADLTGANKRTGVPSRGAEDIGRG